LPFIGIDRRRFRLVMKGARRRRESPHFLGDAVHVDGKADAAVADQGKA
jgi:hypothetical protein